jgi:tetratricopeptide (TPR) repeat protein
VQRSEDATRYRLLETVREYAQEKLAESGETVTMRERHAAFFLALAEAGVPRWAGPEEYVWLARFEDDYDNLQAALAAGGTGQARLCTALRRFWALRGHTRQGRFWLDVTLSADVPMPAGLRATLLRSAGTMDFLEANLDQACSRVAEALALARHLGDRASVAAALNTLGLVAYRLGEYDSARMMHEEELALFEALKRPAGIAAALQNLGNVALQQGDVITASARFSAALTLRRRLGNQMGIAGLLNSLGNVAFRQGDSAAAGALYEQAFGASRALGSQAADGILLHNLGGVAFRQGEYAAARALYEQALAIRRAMGRRWGISATLANLAVLAYAVGDPAGAQALLGESVAYAPEPAATGEVASVLGRLTGDDTPATVGVQTLPLQQAISEALADEDPWWPDAADAQGM